jgi:hypothetical protein
MITVIKTANSAESTATPSLARLRSYYGSDFAAGCSESDRLTDVAPTHHWWWFVKFSICVATIVSDHPGRGIHWWQLLRPVLQNAPSAWLFENFRKGCDQGEK